MKFSRILSGVAARTLLAAGLYNPVRTLYRRFRYEMFRHTLGSFKIRFMVLSVGQACSYKCKNCGNFAPYAPAEFMRYKLEDIISWMKKILEAVDSISVLQIQGGEPFAYSDLGRLITSLSNFEGVV